MSWKLIQEEINKQDEIEELWRSVISYNLDDYPQLRAELSHRSVNIGRQRGYTSFIVNNAKNSDFIIAVNSFQQIDLSTQIIKLGKKCHVFNISNISSLRGISNLTPHSIWIDNFSSFNLTHKRDIESILTDIKLASTPGHHIRIMKMG